MSRREPVGGPFETVESASVKLKHVDIARGVEEEVGGKRYELRFRFKTMDKTALGKARLYLPDRWRGRLPLVISAHYEMPEGNIAGYLRKGWAVLTPFKVPKEYLLNIAGESLIHTLNLVRLAKLLPAVDYSRIAVVGGSAGGYQAAMTASHVFALNAVHVISGVANLPYNLRYFEENMDIIESRDEPGFKVLRELIPLVLGTRDGVRADYGDPRWLALSPVGRAKLMTSPTLFTHSTADLIVPLEQVIPDRTRLRGLPGSFKYRLNGLTGPGYRLSLMDVLPGNDREVLEEKLPKGLPTIWEEGEPAYVQARFSALKTFSIFIIDEGELTPSCAHTKYKFVLDDRNFFEHCFSRPLPGKALTAAKLRDMMASLADLRQSFTEPEKFKELLPSLADVILGLKTYVKEGEDRVIRLKTLYSQLPSSLRSLDVHVEVAGRAVKAVFDEEPLAGLCFFEAILAKLSGACPEPILESLQASFPGSRYCEALKLIKRQGAL